MHCNCSYTVHTRNSTPSSTPSACAPERDDLLGLERHWLVHRALESLSVVEAVAHANSHEARRLGRGVVARLGGHVSCECERIRLRLNSSQNVGPTGGSGDRSDFGTRDHSVARIDEHAVCVGQGTRARSVWTRQAWRERRGHRQALYVLSTRRLWPQFRLSVFALRVLRYTLYLYN